MTGLPSLPTIPPPAPPSTSVASAAHTWLVMARAVSRSGSHTTRMLDTARAGWSGTAADAAATRAGHLAESASEVAGMALSGAAALAAWALALRRLAADRVHLNARTDAASSSLVQLAALPDTRPDAPALRAGAWWRHDDLADGWHRWQASVRKAEDELVASLGAPSSHTYDEQLDAAYRALLALDDSPAADAVRRALADGSGDTYLLDYDPAAFHGDGSAVIAYGAPSTADHVAVVVPGMTTDVLSIGDVGAMALAVRAAAQSRAPGEPTTAVAWVGYDAPADDDLHHGRLDPRDLTDTVRVAGPEAAEEGGRHLSDFVEEVTAHEQDVTVVGHSYGSTTAGRAAASGLDADRLVLLGSPGAGVDRARDLHLPTFVAADDLDAVTWIGSADRHHPGPLGPDPAARAFGATRLPTEASRAPHLDQVGHFAAIHCAYLTPGTTGVAAVADVVTGHAPPTASARTATGADLATDWLLGQAAYELTSWR